ncbi:MAG: TIGR01777 family oxidoreductase [Actinomycetota bacterium]|nr:TIGR01777 family oxidoreductase [Actinomycetota bacterium]
MKVLVSGASGFIGSALVAELTLAGHEVYTLGRSSSDDPKKLSWNIESRTGSLKSIDSLDGVIHLSGESIASKRWTPIQKQKIINSRLEGTDFLIHLLSEANLKPEVFVAGSAVGVYGDRGDEILDESSTPGNGFLSSLTLDWEQRARGAESVASRIALVRTGLVLSNYGGALAKQLPLFKYGLGTILGNGGQYLSWIHLEDEVRAIIHTLTNPEISGPVNLVSPNPVTNREFAKTLAAVLQRPLFLNAPAFVLELALGKEFADEMLLVSQRVTPTALKEAGFEFLFPNLEDALSDLLR